MTYELMMGKFGKYKLGSLVLFLSMVDLGDEGTKDQVIDNIKTSKYLTHYDNRRRSNGELAWRNSFAWDIDHLKKAGYVSKTSPHGIWGITKDGLFAMVGGMFACFEELQAGNRVDGLSGNWYRSALNFIIFVHEKANKSCPAIITPDLVKKINKLTDFEERGLYN